MKTNKHIQKLLYLLTILVLIIAALIFNELITIKNNTKAVGFVTVNSCSHDDAKPKTFFINNKNADKAQSIIKTNEPKTVFLSGNITFPNDTIKVGSNTTLIGVGKNTKISNSGLAIINGANNIIIRNIEFKDAPIDAITIKNNAHHIWIDHCVFSNAKDGLCDITKGSDYITLSWNIFKNQKKTILIGGDDKDENIDKNHLHVTIHHNLFKDSKARMPRVRFGKVHVFNNFYENNSTGIRSTSGAQVLSENNFFYHMYYPVKSHYKHKHKGLLMSRGDIVFKCKRDIKDYDKVFNPRKYYEYSLNNTFLIPIIITLNAGLL